MQFIITFLEGIIAFLSPCILPLLPVYLSFFSGGGDGRARAVLRAVSFVLGFTALFSVLGLFLGTAGSFLTAHRLLVNLVTGAMVILFGLSYLGAFRLPGMNVLRRLGNGGSGSAFLFGMIFAVSMTPCTGAFLGSALMMASASGTSLRGFLLLVCYSLGMGVPYILSAVLVDSIMGAFARVKQHYGLVNRISGGFLIVIGLLMMSGRLGTWMALLS